VVQRKAVKKLYRTPWAKLAKGMILSGGLGTRIALPWTEWYEPSQGGQMRLSKIPVAGLALVFVLSLLTVFSQAAPQGNPQARKPEGKPAQREILPKEVKAIIQEGLANRQGRQEIPFTIFKSLVFPVTGGMHSVIFFKAKNSDLGYATPAPAAPPAKNQEPQSPAPAGVLETRLAVALQFFQPDETGALKVVREAGFPVTLQTQSANYDPGKEEWYALGYALPFGKYTMALLLAPMDPKKPAPDTKRVGVGYCELNLPGPETYQSSLETTPLFLAKSMEQMPSYEPRPTIHKGEFTYSVLRIVPNIDAVVTAEDKGKIEVFFFVLGAKPKAEPAAEIPLAGQAQQPKYDIEINYEVQKEDGSSVIKWQTQNYVSYLVDQELPLKRTLKTGDKTEEKPLDPGKYNLVMKITDKVSGLTLEKKMPFEMK
jgi:hypothetical protein